MCVCVCVCAEGWIHSTSEMSMTILPSAGMDWSTVDTMICRFFKNLEPNNGNEKTQRYLQLLL